MLAVPRARTHFDVERDRVVALRLRVLVREVVDELGEEHGARGRQLALVQHAADVRVRRGVHVGGEGGQRGDERRAELVLGVHAVDLGVVRVVAGGGPHRVGLLAPPAFPEKAELRRTAAAGEAGTGDLPLLAAVAGHQVAGLADHTGSSGLQTGRRERGGVNDVRDGTRRSANPVAFRQRPLDVAVQADVFVHQVLVEVGVRGNHLDLRDLFLRRVLPAAADEHREEQHRDADGQQPTTPHRETGHEYPPLIGQLRRGA